MKLIAATSLLLSITAVSGFVSPSQSASAFGIRDANSVQHNEKTAIFLTPSDIDVQATAASIQDLIHSTSTLLSDASAAVDVPEAAKDAGWWENYLNLYKSLLLGVHSVVDQPLRNVGWDQTWGVSIFLFTALVRTALLPLSIQQTKSSEYIKLLKPYQDEIKEKFKDNKDMANRATAKLFEDANANPLSGCLISILQLPILIGLYRSISLLAKDGQLQEPFLWIPSLEGPVSAANDYRGMEWLTEGWVDGVPSLGWEATVAFLIMPVVLVLGQKLTMSVLTPEPDTSKMSDEEKEQQEKTAGILTFLPLLIGFFSLQVPAGLTIYWFTSNLYSLSQSLIIRKYYETNPPEIELPDYWDALDDVASMSPEEQRKAAEAGMAVGPKWQDVLDEANFHYVVERTALRENSAVWERAQKENVEIPAELLAWVNAEVESLKEETTMKATNSSDLETATAA